MRHSGGRPRLQGCAGQTTQVGLKSSHEILWEKRSSCLPVWPELRVLSVNVKKADWSLLGQSVSGLHSNNDKSLHSVIFQSAKADYNFHKRDDDDAALFMNDDSQLCRWRCFFVYYEHKHSLILELTYSRKTEIVFFIKISYTVNWLRIFFGAGWRLRESRWRKSSLSSSVWTPTLRNRPRSETWSNSVNGYSKLNLLKYTWFMERCFICDGTILCRWLQLAQLAKGKKSRP
jgi:hypothetical protein